MTSQTPMRMSIEFEREPVFAGQTLRGSVHFTLKHTTTIKNVLLIFDGTCCTSSAADGPPSMKPCREQCLFRVQVPCVSHLQASSNTAAGDESHHGQTVQTNCSSPPTSDHRPVRVPPGEHVIPFTFPLAAGLPSAFGGKYGYIYYSCKTTVIVSGALGINHEHHVERAIPLIGIEDLNWHARNNAPLTLRHTLKKKMFCLTRKHVELVVQMAKSGFVPGEPLNVRAEIVNNHKQNPVQRVAFDIVQTVYYTCPGDRERVTRATVGSYERTDIGAGRTAIVDDGECTLKAPSGVPSFLRGCELITIHYDLVVSVDSRECLRTPIIIGTVPFKNEQVSRPRAIEWQTTPPQAQSAKIDEQDVDMDENHNENNYDKSRMPRHHMPHWHAHPPPPPPPGHFIRPPPPPFMQPPFIAPPRYMRATAPDVYTIHPSYYDPRWSRPAPHCDNNQTPSDGHVLKIEEIIE